MTAAVGAGRLLSQVVCAALVFISGPQKDTQESGSEGFDVVWSLCSSPAPNNTQSCTQVSL